MAEYRKDPTHVKTMEGMEVDDEQEPHVSLSTIMAVFVSPYISWRTKTRSLKQIN